MRPWRLQHAGKIVNTSRTTGMLKAWGSLTLWGWIFQIIIQDRDSFFAPMYMGYTVRIQGSLVQIEMKMWECFSIISHSGGSFPCPNKLKYHLSILITHIVERHFHKVWPQWALSTVLKGRQYKYFHHLCFIEAKLRLRESKHPGYLSVWVRTWIQAFGFQGEFIL